MTIIENQQNNRNHYSSLIIRQVNCLKQKGLDMQQIAEHLLLPVDEVDAILHIAA